MPNNPQDRYLRQSHAFPSDRRHSSALAVFGAEAHAAAGMALLAGAAAMGIPVVGSDFHGPYRTGHWLTGEFPSMVERINSDVSYEFLDPDVPSVDLQYLAEGRQNAWVVVLLNNPVHARSVLVALAKDAIKARVLLMLIGPGGLVVDRHPDPVSALERVRTLPADLVCTGSAELAIAAGGLALNEIMMAATTQDDLLMSRMVGVYSLHRQRRVTIGTESINELFAEVAVASDGPVASFAGRRMAMVGAGALGNWSVIPLAIDGPKELVIYDGDPKVAFHNINRQVLLVDGVGQQQHKVEVLAEQLRLLDSNGRYEGIVRFIRTSRDLGELANVDVLLCVPDNDEARLVCDEARREAGVLFATAGSSAVGGQAIVRCACHGCLRCLGLGNKSESMNDSQSCSLVQNDAVVSSNMVVAGLMISELREALAGRSPANVRFAGDSGAGNRLVRMISGSRCRHVPVTAR